jgi:hypothetical protein
MKMFEILNCIKEIDSITKPILHQSSRGHARHHMAKLHHQPDNMDNIIKRIQSKHRRIQGMGNHGLKIEMDVKESEPLSTALSATSNHHYY